MTGGGKVNRDKCLSSEKKIVDGMNNKGLGQSSSNDGMIEEAWDWGQTRWTLTVQELTEAQVEDITED